MKESQKAQLEIQESVLEYFENVDTPTVVEIVNSFVYNNPSNNQKVSELVQKFLDDNGLNKAYVNYLSDLMNPDKYFLSASMSEAGMLNDIRLAFLNLSFNRLRNQTNEVKKVENKNKSNFNFLKSELLKCYECLNRSEFYFNGKEEDAEFVSKVEGMKYE